MLGQISFQLTELTDACYMNDSQMDHSREGTVTFA